MRDGVVFSPEKLCEGNFVLEKPIERVDLKRGLIDDVRLLGALGVWWGKIGKPKLIALQDTAPNVQH